VDIPEEAKMNAVHLSGRVSDYGPKLSYTEAGKPQTTFTLIVEDGSFKTFVPVLILGSQAEHCAETLEAGALVLINGKLAYKSGKIKGSGKLIVTAFGVEIISPVSAPVPAGKAEG
jgi:single-stranded DNA-binding protein